MSYITEGTSKQVLEVFGKWLESYNITRIQWVALYFIFTEGTISQRELSRLMNINDSSSMRLVQRMERDDLLVRKRSEVDRRIIYIYLTEKGTNLITKLMPVGLKFSKLLLKGISDEEFEVFQKVLDQMLINVQGYEDY
ncbi:MarR family transcriptional regulator [Mycoplasmatota bacterium]|nr:MarR family transcriptional regulator [Mycoplasmatota bacterium]